VLDDLCGPERCCAPIYDVFEVQEFVPVWGWLVLKREKPERETGTLRVASELPEAETLMNELLNFQVKITAAANDTYGAWREGTHDDLVLAVALTCWWVSVAPAPVMIW
jgi:hypothetical protein